MLTASVYYLSLVLIVSLTRYFILFTIFNQKNNESI